jgi:hypothetical protein
MSHVLIPLFGKPLFVRSNRQTMARGQPIADLLWSVRQQALGEAECCISVPKLHVQLKIDQSNMPSVAPLY